eukprot:6082292-Pyramimonas_sp.AAC.1
MEYCFKALKTRWRSLNRRRARQYLGFVIDDQEMPLTNLRCADDVLLLAQNKQDVAKMLAHLQTNAARYGLRVHLGTTK